MSKQRFVDAYFECAEWCGWDPDEEGIMSTECQRQMDEDASVFYDNFSELWGYEDEQAGHDFWLTRNRHGAGFWDRPEIYGQANADKLTQMAHAYGEFWLY